MKRGFFERPRGDDPVSPPNPHMPSPSPSVGSEANRASAEELVVKANACHDAGDEAAARKLVEKSLRMCETPSGRKLKNHLDKFGSGSDAAAAVRRVLNAPVHAHYVVMGVQPGCSDGQVKKAYKSLSLELHPDRNHAKGAEEAFKRLAESFAVLGNATERGRYDRTNGHSAQSKQQANPRGSYQQQQKQQQQQRWEQEQQWKAEREAEAQRWKQEQQRWSQQHQQQQQPSYQSYDGRSAADGRSYQSYANGSRGAHTSDAAAAERQKLLEELSRFRQEIGNHRKKSEKAQNELYADLKTRPRTRTLTRTRTLGSTLILTHRACRCCWPARAQVASPRRVGRIEACGGRCLGRAARGQASPQRARALMA
jgi:curved DNA-binding protein CbpA